MLRASIIVPTYRRSATLRDTLATLQGQTCAHGEYEVIVVDNAPTPTPELIDLCECLDVQHLRYVSEVRPGLHRARHTGAFQADSDLLVYIDDDVICPERWLSEMIQPFNDPRIAMVAGKVTLHFESRPPDWIEEFSSSLSALDLGDLAHAIAPYGSPVGCNMAVRKSAVFDLGGFNPDGFGDRRLIRFRGDGECGFARKIHDANLLVWYAPQAVLKHRVPPNRMTTEYMSQRAENSGIESAYRILRYGRRRKTAMAVFCFRSSMGIIWRGFQALAAKRKSRVRFRKYSASMLHWHALKQCARLILSRTLRDHNLKDSYLE